MTWFALWFWIERVSRDAFEPPENSVGSGRESHPKAPGASTWFGRPETMWSRLSTPVPCPQGVTEMSGMGGFARVCTGDLPCGRWDLATRTVIMAQGRQCLTWVGLSVFDSEKGIGVPRKHRQNASVGRTSSRPGNRHPRNGEHRISS